MPFSKKILICFFSLFAFFLGCTRKPAAFDEGIPESKFVDLSFDDSPIFDSQTFTQFGNSSIEIRLTAIPSEKTNSAIAHYSLETQPQHGTLNGLLPKLTYVPNPAFSGVDSFTVRATAEDQKFNEAEITLFIKDTPEQIAVGKSFVCALSHSGNVRCWKAETATLELNNYNLLPQLQFGADFKSRDIQMSEDQICSLSTEGLLKCGEVGSVDKNALLPGKSVSKIKMGPTHSCALTSNGKVWCWGSNEHGQLGLGHTLSTPTPTEVALPSSKTVTDLALGHYHSCVLFSDGSVSCWGSNTHGQLGLENTNPIGDGANEMGANLPTVSLGSGLNVTQILAAGGRSCALFSNQTAKCWGANFKDLLGVGDENHRGDEPGEMGNSLPIMNLQTNHLVKELKLAPFTSCVLLTSDQAKCWGTESSQPELGSKDRILSLSLGQSHLCALIADKTIRCWAL